MPKTLPVPSPVTSLKRHCVDLHFHLPIGGELKCSASFVVRETREDDSVADTEDNRRVTLTQAEIAALPAFQDAYAQLSAAVHAKRDALDEPAA